MVSKALKGQTAHYSLLFLFFFFISTFIYFFLFFCFSDRRKEEDRLIGNTVDAEFRNIFVTRRKRNTVEQILYVSVWVCMCVCGCECVCVTLCVWICVSTRVWISECVSSHENKVEKNSALMVCLSRIAHEVFLILIFFFWSFIR